MSSVQDFANTIRDDPKFLIKWCKSEIKEYEKVIKILEASIAREKKNRKNL